MDESAHHGVHGQYAGFVTRLFAFAIDSGIVGGVTVVVTWAAISLLQYVGIDVRDCPPIPAEFDPVIWSCHMALWVGIVVGAVFPSVYTLLFWSTTGQSPGKAVMGVRIVRLDGQPMNLWTAVLRVIGYGISLSTMGLGFLLILSDNRRQGIADKLAGTCVVYCWDGRRV
jgi:uncharacterized RDD family membrane protein YckC